MGSLRVVKHSLRKIVRSINLAKLSNLIVNGWVWEPKKDVASCVKHGGPASRGWSHDFRIIPLRNGHAGNRSILVPAGKDIERDAGIRVDRNPQRANRIFYGNVKEMWGSDSGPSFFMRTSVLERTTREGDSPVFVVKRVDAEYPEYVASDIATEHSGHYPETLNTSQNR